MELKDITKEVQNWIIETLFISNCYSNERERFISPDFRGVTLCIELQYVLDVPDEALPVYLNSKDDALRISVVGENEWIYVKNIDVEDNFSYLTEIILKDMAGIEY